MILATWGKYISLLVPQIRESSLFALKYQQIKKKISLLQTR